MSYSVQNIRNVCLLGSIVGSLLVFYMVFQGAYGLLTPLLLEVFLLLWTLPVLIFSRN